VVFCSVAGPDPGSGISFFPDHVSQTHIFVSLVTIFWEKVQIVGNWPKFFLQHFKTKIIHNFVKFVATKKRYDNNFFFHPSLLLLFLDPDG
jgi:hypothetical protein